MDKFLLGEKVMAKIGYVRVSSSDQNPQRQLEKLKKIGCKKIFQDKVSGVQKERPGLIAMLSYIRDDDVVITTDLDRLGRDNDDLTNILEEIRRKGASFEAMDLPSTSGIRDKNIRRLINNVIIEVYKYTAENERRKIRERQRQGIDIAKKEGRYRGGQFKFNRDDPRLQLAFRFYMEGKSIREVSALTGIATATFNRYKKRYGIKRTKED